MSPTSVTLESLVARLSSGESLAPESIPEALRDHPEIIRLVALSRVLGQLGANLASLDDEAPPIPASTAPDRLGPFRLVRVLGTGGMGEVWLGERADGEVEQRVAVKRVRGGDSRFSERLREERRILARLEHPNIARFIDAGVDAAGTPWLALEYVDGVPITDWCQQRNLGLAERLRLFIKVCAAVEHAHRHLVVHRDLKPSNILVNADGEPKLLDFGIARLLDGSMSEATQTALTPAYASPEQLRGGAVSTATDVYGLGLVLFRVLAGNLPDTRTGEGLAQVLARVDEEETERPSLRAARGDRPLPYPAGALEGDLDAIVAQALRADPAQRYGSVAMLAEDVARFLDSRPVLARAPSRWYRAGRFLRRHALAVAFAGLAAIALIAGTAIALDQARRATLAAARADAEAVAARAALERAERGQRFLADLFASASPETNRGQMPTARDLIADGERRLLAGELPDADRADLAITIAESWNALGDSEAAQRALGVAARSISLDQTRSLARIAVLLGRIDVTRGDNVTARRNFTNAATLASAAGSEADHEAASADIGLSQIALNAADYPEALALAQIAHARREATQGAESPATLNAGVGLGVALMSNDRLDEAIERLEVTAKLADRALGIPNAVSCRAGTSLNDALERRGDFQRAVDVGIGAARDCLSVFGPGHARYARAELNTGLVLARLGKLEEALARYEAARRAYAAAGHFEEGSALRYAAGALMTLERWDEAAKVLADAESILSGRLGPDGELVLATRLNRAFVLNELGQPVQALALAEAAQESLLKTLPPDHDVLRYAMRVLATIHRKQRRYDQSIEILERLIDAERRATGEDNPALAVANQQLARTLMARRATDDPARARVLLDAAIESLSRPGRSPLLLAAALLDRAELLADLEPATASADRAAAERAAAEVPTLPASIRRRLGKA
jgi:serine/threonine-protein kinase